MSMPKPFELTSASLSAVVLSLTATLSACGGGGSSSGSTPPPSATQPPPQVQTTLAQGTVTGFGSVFVNGVEWETENCEVSVDDQAADESQLSVGDIVDVEGSIDENGNAHCDTMEYDAEIEGPVDEIGADYIMVLGFRIDITPDTVFDEELSPPDLTSLALGDKVEVSAFRTDGGFIATRIDVEVDDGEVEIYGQVQMLDTSTSTFALDDLMVDYSSASFEDFDGADIADGDFVEVEGNDFNADGALIATKVELEDNNPYDDGEEGDEFEIEGYLAVAEDGSQSVNGTPIVLATDVMFENGSADDFVDGARVELEGHLNSASELEVDEVSFKLASELEIEAPLEATPDGTSVTVLGLTIMVNDTTQMYDESAMDDTYFNLADLVAGDWIEVKAARSAAGELIATRIEREDAQELVAIEGDIETIDGDQLTIAGIAILLSAETLLPEGVADLSALLELLSVGLEIEVEGSVEEGENGTQIIATMIEIDD